MSMASWGQYLGGIAKTLIETTTSKAKNMSFSKIYLFAFDPTLPDYYAKLGWQTIAMDEFKGYSVTVMEIQL